MRSDPGSTVSICHGKGVRLAESPISVGRSCHLHNDKAKPTSRSSCSVNPSVRVWRRLFVRRRQVLDGCRTDQRAAVATGDSQRQDTYSQRQRPAASKSELVGKVPPPQSISQRGNPEHDDQRRLVILLHNGFRRCSALIVTAPSIEKLLAADITFRNAY